MLGPHQNSLAQKMTDFHLQFCVLHFGNGASAMQVDNAGIDILLVGDSVAIVVHGHDTTLPITLDDTILYCKAV